MDWALSCSPMLSLPLAFRRFQRFNSWDFITQPDALATTVVEDVFGKRPLVIIAITFVVVAGLYWILND